MSENPRQQLLLERVQEDERLRGDLEGEAAASLVAWASDKVRAASNDPARPDAEVEADVHTIRATARQIARSGVLDPQQVVVQAEVALTAAAAVQPQAAGSPTPTQAEAALTAAAVQPQAAGSPMPTQVEVGVPREIRRSGWRLGERLRRWFTRKD
ncbi:MAG: hypothetical protein H7Z42_12525 [Roseiflexaceae bacterium]|nr:hypothetical protein [Roseiflexaceae bacterium]